MKNPSKILQRKPALLDIIFNAEQRKNRGAEAAQENGPSHIFLSANPDRTWSAVASSNAPKGKSAHLVQEQSYPVEVIYTRFDLNGSSVVEGDVCNNRKELLSSLNWIGKCGSVPTHIWDFKLDASEDQTLFDIINDSTKRRFELAQEDMWEALSVEEEDIEPYEGYTNLIRKEPDDERLPF